MVHQQSRNFLLVGVGASAGGLAPLKQFVKSLPDKPGMAYIVVQHLDPSHKSMLSDILSRQSKLCVKSAGDGERVRPDTIYVLPPDRYLELEDGTIKLSKQDDERGSRKAIDQFFRSLARDCGDRCAGLVFSGAGSDGTAGLRAVKASGGLVLVQDPEEAEHASMPRSAIDADVVDEAVPVGEMQALLRQYANHPMRRGFEKTRSQQSAEVESPDESLEDVAAILKAHEDFQLNQYKPTTVQRRIARRMSLTNTEKTKDYLQMLRDSDSERKQLARDLLINVTDFFRDPEAFQVLEQRVIPAILDSVEKSEDIRVWVAGCASGEEAYSIAILLSETLAKKQMKNDIKIFATDIDEFAIKIARKGVYPESIAAEVPAEYLDKYFTKSDNDHHYQIKNKVRDLISFATQNVASDPPFNRMHLISCRNLLIYLTRQMQEKVLASFYFSLNSNHYLFLGSSESLGNKADLFKTTSKKWRFYQKIPGSNEREVMLDHLHIVAKETSGSDRDYARKPRRQISHRNKGLSRVDNMQRAILATQVPATMVVKEDGTLLYSLGELEAFCTFPTGEPRHEVTQLLRPALRSRVRSAFYKVKKNNEALTFHASFPAKDPADKKSLVRVRIVPVPDQNFTAGTAYTISFVKEDTLTDKDAGKLITDDEQKVNAELEQELLETKEELQNTIEELETSTEELKASHEEALSTNEELHSSNEELEASSEELRSLNEELGTVNAQLKEKIEELRRAHDDVENFFESTDIPTIFLDPELKIQRYTPAAGHLLKIGRHDIDRIVTTLARDLVDFNLIEECNTVLRNFQPQFREIQDYQGNWFIRQVTPYRTEERRIGGVVIVFQNITELKELSQRAEGREKQQAVVAKLGLLALAGAEPEALMHQAVRQVAHVLDADYCKVLKYQPGENNLLMVCGIGWQEGLVGKATVPADQSSHAGFTLLSQDPVIVKRLDQENRFSGPDLLVEHKIVSGISCLINHTNPAYGVIGVYTKSQRNFTGDDANFLQAIANMLSTAMSTNEAQEKLFESEEKFRTMANSIPQLAWMTDETGYIFWYNQRWFDYTGTTLEEMAGWGWQKVHHPNHLERVVARIKRSFDSGEEWEDTFPLRGKDGEYRSFLSRAVPIRNKSGDIIRWFGTNTDITEELKRKRQLEYSEMRLRRVIDNMATFIGELNPEGELVEVNTPALTAAGIAREEVIDKKFWDCYWWAHDPAAQEALKQAFAKALQGETVRYDATVRMKEDGRRDIDFMLSPVFDDNGQVMLVIPSGIDITERKKAEAEVNKNQQLIKAVTDSIPNPLFAKDKERRLLFANKATYDACKKQSEDILGKKDEDWILDDDIAAQIKEHDELVFEKGEPLKFEELITGPDGEKRFYIGTKMPWRNDQGEIIGLVGGFTDITERKELENNLNSAVKGLQEADQKKNEFLSILGHELRNPLAALSGSIEIFATSNPQNQDLLGIMKNSVSTMRDLLDDLLDLHRISHNKIQLKRTSVNIKPVLQNVVEQTQKQFAINNHKIKVDLLDEMWVDGDKVRLEQIFTNLLVNACKYTPEGGNIELKASAGKEQVCIEILDNGIGIDKSMLAKIFEPFYQIEREGKAQMGLGIGLTLAKDLVDLHGGEIRAVSEGRGQGATFAVTLPALKISAPDAAGSADKEHYPIKPGLKVLLIEDNEDILSVMPVLLESLECRVETASNGKAGVAKAISFQPDAVFVDLGLPDISGHEVGKELRNKGYTGPMIVVSGYGHTEIREKSEEAGFDDHIAKPATLEHFKRLLAKIS